MIKDGRKIAIGAGAVLIGIGVYAAISRRAEAAPEPMPPGLGPEPGPNDPRIIDIVMPSSIKPGQMFTVTSTWFLPKPWISPPTAMGPVGEPVGVEEIVDTPVYICELGARSLNGIPWTIPDKSRPPLAYPVWGPPIYPTLEVTAHPWIILHEYGMYRKNLVWSSPELPYFWLGEADPEAEFPSKSSEYLSKPSNIYTASESVLAQWDGLGGEENFMFTEGIQTGLPGSSMFPYGILPRGKYEIRAEIRAGKEVLSGGTQQFPKGWASYIPPTHTYQFRIGYLDVV